MKDECKDILQIDKPNKTEYIYLLQEREFIKTKDF